MLVVKLIEAFVRIFGRVGFHRTRHVVDSGLYGACGLAGWFGSQPRRRPRRNGHHHRPSGSGSAPPLRIASSQLSLAKPGHQLPTPSSSAPPSVLRPEHALQPYREESDDEDGYIMGAWHSYTKPGYSAVEDHAFTDLTLLPQKASGFTRVGGGRAHFDTPYAIQSGSMASLDGDAMPPNHAVMPRSPIIITLPPHSDSAQSPQPRASPGVDNLQSNAANNNRPGSSGSGGSGPSPSPVIGRAAGRQNLPHGAMPPAHFRVQSQSAIVVNPGFMGNSPGTVGSSGSGNGTGTSNVPGNMSPIRMPPIRYASDDGSFDSAPVTPKKKPWFKGLRVKGHSDSSPPDDEEAGPPTDNTGGNAPGRSFMVVRKGQSQGPSHRKDPSTTESSGGDDAGQKKGTFVVLRGRDA
jgi:hypothetical protein